MVQLWKGTKGTRNPKDYHRHSLNKSASPPSLFRNAVAAAQAHDDEYASAEEETEVCDRATDAEHSAGSRETVEALRIEANEWQDRANCFEAILETRTKECHELMEVCEQYEEEKELLVLNVSCQVNGACAMKFIGLKVTLRRLCWGFTTWRLALGSKRRLNAKQDVFFAEEERDKAINTERRESRCCKHLCSLRESCMTLPLSSLWGLVRYYSEVRLIAWVICNIPRGATCVSEFTCSGLTLTPSYMTDHSLHDRTRARERALRLLQVASHYGPAASRVSGGESGPAGPVKRGPGVGGEAEHGG